MERTFASSILVILATACEPSRNDLPYDPPPPTAQEQIADFLRVTKGLAPVHAQVAYTGTCLTPDWDELHPDDPLLDWPTFLPAEISTLVDSHPLLGLSAQDQVIVVREPTFLSGFEADSPVVLMASRWNGSSDVTCNNQSIAGRVVVRTGWFGIDVAQDEMFDATSAQSDDLGLVPLDDIAVSILASSGT